MASAILLTAFLVYLQTYACFGHPTNFFNQNNLGKKPSGTAGAQSSPNTFFSKNLTRNGNIANSLQGNVQKLTNLQSCMNVPQELPFNIQQANNLQRNMLALANLEQQSANLQPQLPVAAPYNAPSSANSQPKPSPNLLESVQSFNAPSSPNIGHLQGQQQSYQLPIQSQIQSQYSLQNVPQSISVPATSAPSYSFSPSYGIPVTPFIVSNNNPMPLKEISKVYSPQNFNPYPIAQPSIVSYVPSFNPSSAIMIGQNDILFNTQDPFSPAYISVVQAPNIPQYRVAPSYSVNTIMTDNQNAKQTSIKALLPILINLLKEKSTTCPCQGCNCECKKKRGKVQVTDGYSKQKKYPLSEDGPAIEALSQEVDMTRNVREPKKAGKLKNTIPDESTETHDDESLEYSEEDDEENK